MIFFTPDSAMEWLRGKVNAIFAARGILQDQYGHAIVARSKTMSGENRVRLNQLIEDLKSSLESQTSLENKIRAVLPASMVPQTLGLAPLIIGAGVIAIAGAAYLHLQNVAKHRETLALVERGILTPAQAIQLQSTGTLLGGAGLSGITENLGTIMMVAVAGFALYLFGPMVARSFGGRK